MQARETPSDEIERLWNAQRTALDMQAAAPSVAHRIQKLKALQQELKLNEKAITDALYQDLRKSPEEAFLSEIQVLHSELRLHIKNVRRWSRTKRVGTPWYLFPASSYLSYEPFGQVLIMSPWNYPVLLMLQPLIGTLSAGNRAIIKPSPFTPHCNSIIKEIIERVFDPTEVALIEGGKPAAETLLKLRFDFIFFTGSPAVGRIVMKAAAEHLCPVLLELGGKSPVIVDEDAQIKIAAKRIAWSKVLNSGQTCIASDYVLVHASKKQDLLQALKTAFTELSGTQPIDNPGYPQMIHDEAFERLHRYKKELKGTLNLSDDAEKKLLSPEVFDLTESKDSGIMGEEIFGPLLPVFAFTELSEAIKYINKREKPLALYYFGGNHGGERVINETRSGGVCINDTVLHIANPSLPFGGVGQSGMGSYHGKESFLAFSHRKAIFKNTTLFDLPFRYQPFKWVPLLRKVL